MGWVSTTAILGGWPEHRDWKLGDPFYAPRIADTARINAFVTVDAGITRPTVVGERTFLMKHVHIGHDAQIGDDCELAPHTTICGHAELGDGVKVGANACVRPFIKVGDGARIGMGAVVVKDVPAGEVWVGNPARKLEKKQASELTDSEVEGWDLYASGFPV